MADFNEHFMGIDLTSDEDQRAIHVMDRATREPVQLEPIVGEERETFRERLETQLYRKGEKKPELKQPIDICRICGEKTDEKGSVCTPCFDAGCKTGALRELFKHPTAFGGIFRATR